MQSFIHNTIYTPTSPFTYGNWTGLLSITLDPNGFGSYLIGEGLNGGYTVGSFTVGIPTWFQTGNAARIEASITTPKTVYTQGDKITYIITYKLYSTATSTTPFATYTESAVLDTKDIAVGTVMLKSQYGTVVSVVVAVKQGVTLGQAPNDFDQKILDFSSTDIPAPLIKSLIRKESNFKPDAIRYEIHTDYNWYSRFGPSTPLQPSWRGVWNYPEKHWRLAGHNALGDIFAVGDQVKDMRTDIYTRMREYTTPKLNIININRDDTITAQEVKDGNPTRSWTFLPPTLDYTAQLLLASSYGLMQVLYETARWNNFEGDTVSPARHIEELFDPKTNIQMGVRVLNFFYQNNVTNHPDWTYEQKIKDALLNYNGGGDPNYAKTVYNDFYLSGIYNKN